MVYQASINYKVKRTAEEQAAYDHQCRPMTSRTCKAEFKARYQQNEVTYEELEEIRERHKLDDIAWKKSEQLARLKRIRQEKLLKLKLAKEALRREPGPVKAKWEADEPKTRITDFFK